MATPDVRTPLYECHFASPKYTQINSWDKATGLYIPQWWPL